MKLSDLKRAETAVISLRHPATGQPAGATVTVYGTTAPGLIEAQDRYRQRMAKLVRRFKSEDAVPAEESQLARREFMADCTVAWSGILGDDDSELPISRAGLLQLYADPDVLNQVAVEMADAANFMQSSRKG